MLSSASTYATTVWYMRPASAFVAALLFQWRRSTSKFLSGKRTVSLLVRSAFCDVVCEMVLGSMFLNGSTDGPEAAKSSLETWQVLSNRSTAVFLTRPAACGASSLLVAMFCIALALPMVGSLLDRLSRRGWEDCQSLVLQAVPRESVAEVAIAETAEGHEVRALRDVSVGVDQVQEVERRHASPPRQRKSWSGTRAISPQAVPTRRISNGGTGQHGTTKMLTAQWEERLDGSRRPSRSKMVACRNFDETGELPRPRKLRFSSASNSPTEDHSLAVRVGEDGGQLEVHSFLRAVAAGHDQQIRMLQETVSRLKACSETS